ncbi:hypothetical protein TNCV_3322031 [Trichonephila clavipes]|nr:hypothetical protein TNCV_3322031 [Trichonephila clavipes]
MNRRGKKICILILLLTNFPDSIARPIAILPLSRMENTTFAMPSIIDSHDMGLRTVYSPDARKKTPIQRLFLLISRTYSNFPHFASFHFVVAMDDSVIRP